MAVTAAEDVMVGRMVLSFDGRVLEIFGYGSADALRFHVKNLELTIGEPDMEWRRRVTVKAASQRGNRIELDIAESDWFLAGPLLERARALSETGP